MIKLHKMAQIDKELIKLIKKILTQNKKRKRGKGKRISEYTKRRLEYFKVLKRLYKLVIPLSELQEDYIVVFIDTLTHKRPVISEGLYIRSENVINHSCFLRYDVTKCIALKDLYKLYPKYVKSVVKNITEFSHGGILYTQAKKEKELGYYN